MTPFPSFPLNGGRRIKSQVETRTINSDRDIQVLSQSRTAPCRGRQEGVGLSPAQSALISYIEKVEVIL